jgi:hypothetical protein
VGTQFPFVEEPVVSSIGYPFSVEPPLAPINSNT